MAAVIFFLLATLPASPRVALWTGDPGLPARTIAGAYHIHTTRSDGSGDRAAVAAAAARAGLAFVILTDHGDGTRTPDPPAYVEGVLCIDGVEISTTGGHYVALGLGPAPYPLGGAPSAVVEDVARLGGFGFAAHPDSPRPELAWTDWDAAIDGLEWLSADSEWRDESRARLARVLLDYALRPGPALASILDRPTTTLARWDRLTSRRPVIAIAGHDAHGGIGRGVEGGEKLAVAGVPSYEASFRAFSVRAVLSARPSGEASADARALLDALRNGRVYTAVDAIAGSAVLDFHASRGGEQSAMGSVLPPGPVTLSAHAAVPPGARTVLIRDGREVKSADGGAVELDEALAQGAYRVEVQVPGAPGTPPVPWLLGNPIYFLPLPVPPAEAVSIQWRLFPDGMPWHVEKDPASTGTVTASPREVALQYALRGGDRASQYVALVADLQGRSRSFRQDSIHRASGAPRARVGAVAVSDRWGRTVGTVRLPRHAAARHRGLARRDGARRPSDRPGPRLGGGDRDALRCRSHERAAGHGERDPNCRARDVHGVRDGHAFRPGAISCSAAMRSLARRPWRNASRSIRSAICRATTAGWLLADVLARGETKVPSPRFT